MSSKTISLEQTRLALKSLNSALSECSALLSEKQLSAEQKDADCKKQLDAAQKKIDILKQSSQNAIANINELASKLDRVLS